MSVVDRALKEWLEKCWNHPREVDAEEQVSFWAGVEYRGHTALHDDVFNDGNGL